MPNGVVDPPTNDLGLTLGGDKPAGGTGGKLGKNKNLIYGGIGVVALAGIYLYAKSRSSSSSSSTTASPEVVAPASNQDSTVGDLGSALTLQGQQNTSSLANQLSQAITALEAEIAGNQAATLSAISSIPTAPSVAGATPAPAPVTAAPALPAINAANWPSIIKFGQDPNAASDFTEIGVVNNGVFNGTNVTGGVPVYAGVLGGYAQGFNESTLPNGTDLYIPTALKAYETQ